MLINHDSIKREIVIDFLYLDLKVCERCKGSDIVLDEAINDVSNVLEKSGIKVIVNKINVNSEFLVYKYKFRSSPTIRVNGQDIQKESNCKSCGSLCGDKVNCRVWVYDGKGYTLPPKALIISKIMNVVHCRREDKAEEKYELLNKKGW